VHLRDFHQHKLTEGLSSRTVRYLHAVLHKALKQAADDGLIPRNAAASAKPPQLRQAEIRPLSPTQAKAFLEAAHGDRMEALYVLAITAGLRQGELLGLKWEDVDLEGGTLQVKRTLSNGIFTAPKTAKSRRSVKLTTRALEILKHHRQRQLEERDRMANLWVDHGLVFATEVGTPMNRHNLNARSFKPLLKRAGLPDRRFHDLRHTCATLLLSKGVHAKFVQELLGHATIAVTLDTYSHVLPGMGNQAANAMEDALS
jgi:integrase